MKNKRCEKQEEKYLERVGRQMQSTSSFGKFFSLQNWAMTLADEAFCQH